MTIAGVGGKGGSDGRLEVELELDRAADELFVSLSFGSFGGAATACQRDYHAAAEPTYLSRWKEEQKS